MICLPHSPWPSISFGLLILGRDLFLRRLVMRYDVVSLLATIKRHNNNNSKKTKKKKNKFNNKNQRLLCYHISILYMVLGACKSCLCLLFFVLSCPLDGNGRPTEYEKLFCQALLTHPPLLWYDRRLPRIKNEQQQLCRNLSVYSLSSSVQR